MGFKNQKLIGVLVYPWCNNHFTNISAYGIQESNVQVGVSHPCTFRLRQSKKLFQIIIPINHEFLGGILQPIYAANMSGYIYGGDDQISYKYQFYVKKTPRLPTYQFSQKIQSKFYFRENNLSFYIYIYIYIYIYYKKSIISRAYSFYKTHYIRLYILHYVSLILQS